MQNRLACVKKERFEILPDQWTNIAEISNTKGYISNFWIAIDSLSGTGNTRGSYIRITFDNEDVPCFGDVNGIAVEGMFGAGFSSSNTYANSHHGCTKNSNGSFSGYLKMVMPFNSGFKVEIKTLPSNKNYWIWLMIEYVIGTKNNNALGNIHNWKLCALQNRSIVLPKSDHILFSSPINVAFHGFFHFFDPIGPYRNINYLEGNYLIGNDYEASGTEDMVNSSYYFNSGLYNNQYVGITYFSNNRTAIYKFWDENDAFPISNMFQWKNGDVGYYESTFNVDTTSIVYFYAQTN